MVQFLARKKGQGASLWRERVACRRPCRMVTVAEVVVGVDESEGAAEALRWAVREAAAHGWAVTAVMAWGFLNQHHPTVAEAFDPNYGEKDAAEALAKIVATRLREYEASMVQPRVVCDLPARALLEVSEGSELLVLGTRGLGGFRGLLLGSVSQHCLHHATSPIAIVRHADEARDTYGRVVVAVDGSDTSKRALAWAVEEARLRQSTLRVVNAWHLPAVVGYPYTEATFDPRIFEHASRQVIDEALGGCDTGSVSVELVSAQGTPAAVILNAAETADLVVMGSRGLGGFKGMLLGSATHQVTHHARCPVVVVPPPRGD